jgi:RNA polymerase sporulation-specific sigma factor
MPESHVPPTGFGSQADNEASDDLAVVARAQAGHEKSIESILRRYRPLAHSKAREYFLPGSGRDDLIQEGMIGLFLAVRDFDPSKGGRFFYFADLCITRHVQTAVKKANRNKHIPLTSAVSMDSQAPGWNTDHTPSSLLAVEVDRSLDPARLVASAEHIELIADHLKQALTKIERDVLEGHLGGKTYKDIAGELGVGIKSIDNALQRIRSKLKNYLSTDIVPDEVHH